MARDHARVYHRIWANRDFRALSEAAQRSYILVLTQPDLNYCGVTTLSMHRWACLAADSTPRRVRKSLGELETARFIATDAATEELLVRSFVRNDGLLSSPNICINVVRTYPSVLSPRLRLLFLIELHRLNQEEQEPGWEKGWAHLAPLLAEPIPEGLPEGFLEGLPEPIPKGLRLAHARRVTRGSCPAPDPVLYARTREDGITPADSAAHAAEARRLLAEKEPKGRTA
jgi:hypothetical protein